MDWSEEPWVKLYTRESTTMAMLPWESRAVLHELMKRVGFDGAVQLGRHGLRGLASLLRMPEEVVSAAMDDLVGEGIAVVPAEGNTVILCNFYEAQRARTSDKERKRRSRESKAAETKASAEGKPVPVTPGHRSSQEVTNRIEETRSEETRLDPPKAPKGAGGLWATFDPSRATEYLEPLWSAWPGHPSPSFTAQAQIAERLFRFLGSSTDAERATTCAALVAWTRRDFQPRDKVRLLLTGDLGEALKPERPNGRGGAGVAPPASHDQHQHGDLSI